MSNIQQESIGKLCSEYFIEYGRELNSNRALPLLMDGLKPSYRRAIYTALMAPGNHIKSLDFVGSMFKLHPHGDKSIIGVETKLVRAKVFKELGNFGYYPIYGEQSTAAAPRYTETGIEDNWYDIMRPLIDSVPFINGEVEGVTEPQYLPTPIPLSLVFGSQGIGLGINTNIPAFNPKSILDAYLADDPSLLKPYYDLEIDYENSQLQRLWETGTGRVVYRYHVYRDTDNSGCEGVVVEGDTQMFEPNWWQINEWKDQGLIFVRDETTGGKNRVFIGKNPYVRKVNQDMIYEECLECCSSMYALEDIQTIYRLGIHDGKIAKYISMKDWVGITYENYLKLVEIYKQNNINKLSFDREVYTYLKQVAEILINAEDDIDNQTIADQIGTTIDVVNAITRKSISTLKRTDTDAMLQKIDNQISDYASINPKEFVELTISKM